MSVFENLWEWFIVQPGRLITVGSVIWGGGATMLIVALWGRVALAATSGLSHLAKTQVDVTLEAIYPGLPTWWIPESTSAFLFASALVVLGLYLVFVGKKIKRLLHYST